MVHFGLVVLQTECHQPFAEEYTPVRVVPGSQTKFEQAKQIQVSSSMLK